MKEKRSVLLICIVTRVVSSLATLAIVCLAGCGWSKFAQTALALNGVPSWNRMPVRRLKVHVRPPFEAFHDFASNGTTVVVPAFIILRLLSYRR